MAMQDETEEDRIRRGQALQKQQGVWEQQAQEMEKHDNKGWAAAIRQAGQQSNTMARSSITPDDWDVMAKQYGGGLRGQAGVRYNQLGGLAAAADSRTIAASENEMQARMQAGLARRQQLGAINEYRAAALGMRPSLAQAQAGREQAYLAGGLGAMGANTKGPNMALGQGLAMGAGANAMAERAGQAADQYAAERQRALAGWSQGVGQVRGADNALYGMEIDRAMQQRGMNDQRQMQLLGMQDAMAESERQARMRFVTMEMQKAQADSDREYAQQLAASDRENARRRMMVGIAAGAATGGAGAALGGAAGGAAAVGGAAAASQAGSK